MTRNSRLKLGVDLAMSHEDRRDQHAGSDGWQLPGPSDPRGDGDDEKEIVALRRRVEFFEEEHRLVARLLAILLIGPGVTTSVRNWFRAKRKELLPEEETVQLIASVVRRMTKVGLIGFLFPGALLVWQNLLIRDQNIYFRESAEELRRQNALQDDRNDLARRRDLIAVVYDRTEQRSMRPRVEALKALVELERSLMKRKLITGSHIGLQGVGLSCNVPGSFDCADLRSFGLESVDFTGAQLQGVNFKNANLRGAVFVGADMSGADLSNAVLIDSRFREDVESISSLPIEELGAKIGKASRLPNEKAFEGAVELRRFLNRRTPELDSLHSLRMDLPQSMRENLDAVTSAAIVEGAIWGSTLSHNLNPRYISQRTRLPFKLYFARNTGVLTE